MKFTQAIVILILSGITLFSFKAKSSYSKSAFLLSDSIPPVAVCQDLTIYLDISGQISLTAVQVDGGSSDNVGIDSMMVLPGNFTCNEVGSNSVVLWVFDASTNSDSCTANVLVLDSIPPQAVCSTLDTVYLDTAGVAQLYPSDLDAGSSDNCWIDNYLLSDSIFACADTGLNYVTMTVWDIAGNSDSCSGAVRALDTIKPVVDCHNVTINLNPFYAYISPNDVATFSDNCGIDFVNLYNDAYACWHVGLTNLNSVFVRDVNGNYRECDFEVTVIDPYLPTIQCQNTTIYSDQNGQAYLWVWDNIAAINNANCNYNVYASQEYFGCDIYPYTVTVSLVEQTGQTATCTSTVTVLDTIAPVANCTDVTITLNSAGNANASQWIIGQNSTDNCFGFSSKTLSQSGFNCSHLGVNQVVLTATDDSQNTDTCHANVTVVDVSPPAALCQNISVYLNSSGNATISSTDIDAGSTDNCPLTGSLDASMFSCSDIGPNTVTMIIYDPSFNTDSCTATVTVIDSVAPTALCQNISVYLDSTNNTSINVADIDSGSTDNCTVNSSSIDISSFTCSNVGVNPVTLTIVDQYNNVGTCIALVTVLDTISPQAICQQLDTLFLDSLGMISLNQFGFGNLSTDNCGISSFVLSDSEFTCIDTGFQAISVVISDAGGNLDSCSITVVVTDSIRPVIECQNDTIYLPMAGFAFLAPTDVATFSDNCGIQSTFIYDDFFACYDIGSNFNLVTAHDFSNNYSDCYFDVVVIDTIIPTIQCLNITVAIDQWGGSTIVPGDVFGGIANSNCSYLLYLSQTSFGCIAGPNVVTLTVLEGGHSLNCQATVTTIDTFPPVALCQNLTVQLNLSGNASISPFQVDSGSSDACIALNFSLNQSAFTCADLGTNPIVLTVEDTNLNTDTCHANVTVVDASPPTALCQSVTLSLDLNGQLQVLGSDLDAGSNDNCAVVSMQVNPSTFDCNDLGVHLLNLTVFDAANNTDSCFAYVTVTDTSGPAMLCQNVNAYLDVNGDATIGLADVDAGSQDACGIDSIWLNQITFSCADVGPNAVTLTARDIHGNSDSCATIVLVLDSVAPLVMCIPDTVYLDALGQATISSSNVDGGSSDACGIGSLNVSPSSFNGNNIGVNQVTLTATDLHGNTSSCMSNVAVLDTLLSGLEAESADNNITLQAFPNPTDGVIRVEIQCSLCISDSPLQLTVANMAGQEIFSKEIYLFGQKHALDIDLSQVAAGPYLLVLRHSGGLLTEKIVRY
jgi:hypothetical protein